MKKQAVFSLVFSHAQCCIVLLLALSSASQTLESEKSFEEPLNVEDKLGAFRLSGDFNRMSMLLKSKSHPWFKYLSHLKNLQNYHGNSMNTDISLGDDLGKVKENPDVNEPLPLHISLRSKNLVDRMPMSFGKRITGESNFLSPETKMAGRYISLNIPHHKNPHGSGNSLRVLKNYLHQFRSGFLRNTRGRLERMPLTFGKRTAEAAITGRSFNMPSNNADTFTVSVRSMLDRMPNYYGKRKRSSTPIPFSGTDSLSKSGDGLNRLTNLNPESKNDYTSLEDSTAGIEDMDEAGKEQEQISKSKRWSRMDRMPLTYGKRADAGNAGFNPHFISSVSGHPRLYLPEIFNQHDKMFRRMRRGELSPLQSAEGSLPTYVSKTRGREISEKLKTLLPDVFGTAHAHADGDSSVVNESEERVRHEAAQTPHLLPFQRLRIIVPKRNNKEDIVYVDLPFLMQQLREQRNKMAPEEYKRFKASAQSALQKYILVDTPLTRSSRSRLGRMPLTYGKRGYSGTLSDNGRVHSKSPENRDRSVIILSPSRRSRMDRMPLSFGKRAATRDHIILPETVAGDEFQSLDPFDGSSSKVALDVHRPSQQEWSRDGRLASPDVQQHNDTDADSGAPPSVNVDDTVRESSDGTFAGPQIPSLSHSDFMQLR